MKNKMVTLYTYKYSAPKRSGVNGESKQVKIPVVWLEKKLAPHTIEDFLDSYTFDDAEYYYNLYQEEKKMEKGKVNTVILNGYKRDENGAGIDGTSRPFYFNLAWVQAKIAPQEMEDFMNDYTYDDTEWLLEEAKREGNAIVRSEA